MASPITIGLLILLCNFLIATHSEDPVEYNDTTLVTSGQFPWQVSLQRCYSNRHICSGAIVSNHWILTAVHCMEGLAHVGQMKAIVGTNQLTDDEGVEYKIRAIYVHPSFLKTIARQHNIALLRTKSKIQFNHMVRAVQLPMQPAMVDEKVYVSGWGVTKVSHSNTQLFHFTNKFKQNTQEKKKRKNPKRIFSVSTRRNDRNKKKIQIFALR